MFAAQGRVVSRKEHPLCPSAFTQPLPRLPARLIEGDPWCGGDGKGAVWIAGMQTCHCIVLPALQCFLSYRNSSLEQCRFKLSLTISHIFKLPSAENLSQPALTLQTLTHISGAIPQLALIHKGQRLYQKSSLCPSVTDLNNQRKTA